MQTLTIKKSPILLSICLACSTISSIASTVAIAQTKQSNQPTQLKKQGKSLSAIVPKNWQVITSKKGDVNNDGIDDLVFVIQDTDKSKIEGGDWDKVDENPRILAIYKGIKNNGNTIFQQQRMVTDFIQLKDNPNLLEPFDADMDGINITDKGVIEVSFSYFMSAGGWEMSNETYKFQWRNQAYQLIGYDYHSRHRASTETTEYSINFLSKKMIRSHYFDDPEEQPTTLDDYSEPLFMNRTVSFELDQPFTLSNINEFDYPVPDILFNNRHYPKSSGKNLTEVIPANWKILTKASGDLNHDGVKDVVAVIQDTFADNIDKETQYDSNPSLVAIYFGNKGAQTQRGMANGLIKQGIYTDDALQNYKPTIDSKGVLSFQRNSSNRYDGKQVDESEVYKFQLRDIYTNSYNSKQFVLIGYDNRKQVSFENSNLKNSSLDNNRTVETLSVNFLTKKAIHNKDGNKQSYRFRLNQPYTLNSDMGYRFSSYTLEKIKQWQY